MAADRRPPNVLLIGAPRCASSSLAIAMSQHPSVFLCTPKEPHFLAMHGRTGQICGMGKENFSASSRLSHRHWLDLFAGRTERYLLDASVSTISYPDPAIPNIERFCDQDTRLVVILRNPVDRAFSSYQYCVSKSWDGGSFEDSLDQEEARIAENWQHLWFLKHLSQYEVTLAPFLDAFGQDRVHVVITEEMAADPARVMRGVFSFLDLPAVEAASVPRINASGAPRSRIVRGLVSYARQRPMIRHTLRAIASDAVREKFRGGNTEKAEMAAETRARLSRDLSATKPWVEQLIGRPLDVWT